MVCTFREPQGASAVWQKERNTLTLSISTGQAILVQVERDENVETLLQTTREVFELAEFSEPLGAIMPDFKQAQILPSIFKQVCICGYFIQSYAKDKTLCCRVASAEVMQNSSTGLHVSGRCHLRLWPLNVAAQLILATSSFISVAAASDLPTSPAPDLAPDRSFTNAIQNINGMSSLFSIIPVLTGKTQNIKLIAARAFPGAMVVAGLGAGRVLLKLQMGLLLVSSNMYQNLVSEFSPHHQEYVNNFSPSLIHIPTGTPERHSSNVIINHNPAEAYMVEAWFQTQGVPALVELQQTNNRRLFVGLVIYLICYAAEVFIEVKNIATGAGLTYIIVQIISAILWMTAVIMIQLNRGQGNPTMELNSLGTPTFRCFQLITSGQHIQSKILSMNLDNLRNFQLFGSNYENRTLKRVGSLLLVSGGADVLGTILVVGLNEWAYGWLGLQVAIILMKVVFSLEPLRHISIKDIRPLDGSPAVLARAKTCLPLAVMSTPEYSFIEVGVQRNVVQEIRTQKRWESRSPGVYIGQPYYCKADSGRSFLAVRYLALSGSTPDSSLTLQDSKPLNEPNQALQREFLAGLAEVVKANKVPSLAFVSAVEQTLEGVRATMEPHWFGFAAKDLQQYLSKCRIGILWCRFI